MIDNPLITLGDFKDFFDSLKLFSPVIIHQYPNVKFDYIGLHEDFVTSRRKGFFKSIHVCNYSDDHNENVDSEFLQFTLIGIDNHPGCDSGSMAAFKCHRTTKDILRLLNSNYFKLAWNLCSKYDYIDIRKKIDEAVKYAIYTSNEKIAMVSSHSGYKFQTSLDKVLISSDDKYGLLGNIYVIDFVDSDPYEWRNIKKIPFYVTYNVNQKISRVPFEMYFGQALKAEFNDYFTFKLSIRTTENRLEITILMEPV